MGHGAWAKMRTQVLAAIVGLFVGFSATATRADTVLWYNGDYNESNALGNGVNANFQSIVYDDFIVPTGQVWTITSAFSHNLMDITVSSAHWEIRSGVSAGDGGTLIASGDSAASQTATGFTGFAMNEYSVEVSGLNVVLGEGTYWLSVSPIGDGSGNVFISTTSGDGAVGVPAGNDDNSFVTSGELGANFEPASDFVGYPADFSMGVIGTMNAVPEPASFVQGAIALLGLAGYRLWPRSSRVKR